jgi:transposase
VRTKPVERPKLGPLTGVIDAILAADRSAPVKQRHTAKRIWQRLRDPHGFDGGYSTVKDYVRLARARAQEVFVPLVHPPGHAQADFGEAVAVIAGETGACRRYRPPGAVAPHFAARIRSVRWRPRNTAVGASASEPTQNGLPPQARLTLSPLSSRAWGRLPSL